MNKREATRAHAEKRKNEITENNKYNKNYAIQRGGILKKERQIYWLSNKYRKLFLLSFLSSFLTPGLEAQEHLCQVGVVVEVVDERFALI